MMSIPTRMFWYCLLVLFTAVLGAVASPVTVPRYFQTVPVSRRDLSVDTVKEELGAVLSTGSTIFGPENPEFNNATVRWNMNGQTDVEVVVRPASESDVSKIVIYCNDNSIDFLPYSGGKGLTTTLKTFSGLQLDLYQLRDITVNYAGTSARIQAGARIGEIISTLWDQDYVASTGSNGCVGVSGLSLGGGYGRLIGQYGLVSDNFINLNIVLANGSEIVVNQKKHTDLFWAMKGAGHNFAFVTSMDVKVYKRENELWHYHNYIFSGDKLETVFEKINTFHNNGSTPTLMAVNFGQVSVDPTYSDTEPIIFWGFAYNGPADDAEVLLEPFNQIEHLWEESGDVSYPEILTVQQTDASSPACNPAPWAGCATGLQVYNVTTERQNYNLYRDTLAQYPDLAAGSRLYYEGYAMAKVKAIDPASSAFPFRDDNHLVFFLAVTLPGLEDQAQALADGIKDLWLAGQPLRRPSTYVNYAFGDEPLEWMYGHEPWRLEKLRKLKGVYDPNNRFRFFNPIIRE